MKYKRNSFLGDDEMSCFTIGGWKYREVVPYRLDRTLHQLVATRQCRVDNHTRRERRLGAAHGRGASAHQKIDIDLVSCVISSLRGVAGSLSTHECPLGTAEGDTQLA